MTATYGITFYPPTTASTGARVITGYDYPTVADAVRVALDNIEHPDRIADADALDTDEWAGPWYAAVETGEPELGEACRVWRYGDEYAVYFPPTRPEHYEGDAIRAPYGDTFHASADAAIEFVAAVVSR